MGPLLCHIPGHTPTQQVSSARRVTVTEKLALGYPCGVLSLPGAPWQEWKWVHKRLPFPNPWSRPEAPAGTVPCPLRYGGHREMLPLLSKPA